MKHTRHPFLTTKLEDINPSIHPEFARRMFKRINLEQARELLGPKAKASQ